MLCHLAINLLSHLLCLQSVCRIQAWSLFRNPRQLYRRLLLCTNLSSIAWTVYSQNTFLVRHSSHSRYLTVCHTFLYWVPNWMGDIQSWNIVVLFRRKESLKTPRAHRKSGLASEASCRWDLDCILSHNRWTMATWFGYLGLLLLSCRRSTPKTWY